MSKIQALLAAATECEPSKRKEETIDSQDYLVRVVKAVADLPEAEWDKLSLEAQDWYNKAADALETKKELPGWPDAEKAEGSTRRRATKSEDAPAKPVKGSVVKVVTKRGRDYEGKIVELDDAGMVLDVDGKDVELDHDKIESVAVLGGGGKSEPASEPEVQEPEVTDTVEIITKRGKTVVGNIVEMDDKIMVLKLTDGSEEEFDKDRLTSVVVKVKNAGKSASSTPRRGGGEKEEKKDPPADTKNTKVTKESNGGVSVTVRMRELICDSLEATKEDVSKALKKEGLEFKDATLNLVYADSHKLIAMLRERKKIK